MIDWLSKWWPYLLLAVGLIVFVQLAGPLVYLIGRGLYAAW